MLPTIALVGRPNVGKSTLFNRLTKSRDALVADFPGLTRDRHYGRGRSGDRAYIVVDTGGFEPVAKSGILKEMARQAREAIAEADVVVFLVDARAGLSEHDREIGELLRRCGRPVVLVANKAEGIPAERAVAEFHELALGEPLAISAAHGEGVRNMLDVALDAVAPAAAGDAAAADEDTEAPPHPGERPGPDARIKVAIIGRPNVGKSTLVNTLLGAERMIAFDEPGTTRDAIHVDFERGGRKYTLIDTAGVRRRGKVFEAVEKFSVIKTLQAIEEAHVVVLLLDAREGISEQDAHIAAHALEAGRAMVVGVNKWDDLDADARTRARTDFDRKLGFLGFADAHYISARDGRGVAALMASVDKAYAAAMIKLSTPRLTRALQDAVARQQPPRAGYSRPKLRYAHQGGVNPPVVVIHGTALAHVPDGYRRYLERFLAEAFKIRGTPLRIQFKTGVNPYAR
ncbi:MAG: ribosome biogenesis GTPase Der [Betaproteobacteria bacterium]|nr:ribosome biogenesis GTPase Der [Betaproteobacteria bacterium]MDH5287342.1 ribosome biogenesis GTPase Der [Betaproteobacteria bacterium]